MSRAHWSTNGCDWLEGRRRVEPEPGRSGDLGIQATAAASPKPTPLSARKVSSVVDQLRYYVLVCTGYDDDWPRRFT